MDALIAFAAEHLDADEAPPKRGHLERTSIASAREAAQWSLSALRAPVTPEALIIFGYASARRRCLAAGFPAHQLTQGDCGSSALAVVTLLELARARGEIWVSCGPASDDTDGLQPIGHAAIRHDEQLYDWTGPIEDDQIFPTVDGDEEAYSYLVTLDPPNYEKTWNWFRKGTGWMISPPTYLRAMAEDLERFAVSQRPRAVTAPRL